MRACLILFIAALSGYIAAAQDAPAPPSGTVIFSRSTADEAAAQAAASVQPVAAVTDQERDALTFSSYVLDVHVTPSESAIAVRAAMSVKNDSDAPLSHFVLQISSSLQWEEIELNGHKLDAKQWQQHALDTDADHTGAVTEAVVTLPTPLAPGAAIHVTGIYSGSVEQAAQRLTRIGAPRSAADAADWDRIAKDFTGLRGFGNVLWYPAASPALFLGDGARLFQAIGRLKLRESHATMQVHLTVEYTGSTPSIAVVNGVSKALATHGDEQIEAGAGIPRAATAEFAAQPIGFRTPSLFLTSAPLATLDKDSALHAYVTHPELLAPYATAASQVLPLITDWVGAPQPLTLLELPESADQPFETNGVLALGLHEAQPSELTLQMVHALARSTAAEVPARAWMDEGLAQFIALLWMERTHGRDAAVDEMNAHGTALALAEPDLSADKPAAGESLILATDEIFYRTKAADVWWMLRDIVGDAALQQAIARYQAQAAFEKEPSLFQRLLEQTSKKDMEWFFDDWVYRDRGLPDLTIAAVVPRQILGKSAYLVAVEVANDGYAAAEVPVTVRAGTVSITERLKIPARAHATTRIVFGGVPQEVQVNDGSVPELRGTVHHMQIDALQKK